MTRAIRRRRRCLREYLRIRIIGVGLFASNDQDPSIRVQRRGLFLSRDRHDMGYVRELTRSRVVLLCCFQQRQSGALFASGDQHHPILKQGRCVECPRRDHVAGRRQSPSRRIVQQRGIEPRSFVLAAGDQYLACSQSRFRVARAFRREWDGRLDLCLAYSEESTKDE